MKKTLLILLTTPLLLMASPADDAINKKILELEKAIVELAQRLHVETIAEFVSTQSILDTVKRLGVDYAQGFHLGKPLSIEEHIKS
ncbi:EAL domain-containing protein [Sulfurimonas autotrophica]|uniref:EAL domain-containing protein n=1 Tax=Sulfurimonas autotrophica TaxID=202747 RepID=UPI0002DF3872|nr:EAL domain-containing protein [Sulfurimonas autotrophica]